MTAISNASPLIILAKIGLLDLLLHLHGQVIISPDVHREVVVSGAGLPGSGQVASAQWIKVKDVREPARIARVAAGAGLGLGEASTVLLAQELRADLALIDDLKARKVAEAEGLKIRGSIGTLEAAFRKGHLSDLRQAFRHLVEAGLYLESPNPRINPEGV